MRHTTSLTRLFLILTTTLFGGVCTAADLAQELLPIIRAHRGKVAVAIKHLPSNTTFEYSSTTPMPTASLIKFPVMVEAYRQIGEKKIDPRRVVSLQATDKVPGSGVLTKHFSDGLQLSIRDSIRLMIAFSDNTATNVVVDEIGIKSVADTMEKLGLPNTKLHAKVFRRETSVFPDRSREFGLGSTTAAEIARLFEMVHRRELLTPAACDEILEHLRNCEDKSMLARSLPPGVTLAHKSGAVTAVRCDAGIMETKGGPIIICVLTNENDDRRWVPENAAELLCADIAKRTYRFFDAQSGENAAAGDAVLRVGANGTLVESLQRTLNAKLKPSPELSVDGEFGPATKEAVTKWQRSANLEATGIVDRSTWESLGPLVSEGPAVPEPDDVNREQLASSPPDALDGAPYVTSKAWTIVDRKSGVVLWGENERASLDIASTTKIMTAYIVLTLAARDAAVLDEVVTFSQAADETIGSSAEIRAGERLPVRELLFGLMLPSGNDAAAALAEHFGGRLGTSPNSSAVESPTERFVAEMNRTAVGLGMANTSYRNPHGLTQADHRSTAVDLAILARAALQIPEFARYVSTRQHGYAVTGPGGYRRNVVWKNTNRLLGIEGYQGVKTGTTDAAGACLVSLGKRGDDELLVVVLGATSSDARYVDSRNLFRWAWRQRQ